MLIVVISNVFGKQCQMLSFSYSLTGSFFKRTRGEMPNIMFCLKEYRLQSPQEVLR